MNTEISSILTQDGRLVEWAEKVVYKLDLSAEDNDISQVTDAWLKDIVGRTGHDTNHEISQLILKTITPEVVAAPSMLLDRMFSSGSIGEFDDARYEVTPKNTIQVYDSIPGGNVDRSFIDFSALTPTWRSLQAETDVKLQEIRRGGYRTVATLVNYIREALEYKKIAVVMAGVDTLIASGAAGYVSESTSAPTATSMDALALYLHDTADGETPFAYGLSKYIQAVNKLAGQTTFLTDKEKSLFNNTGFINQYAGLELLGFSGQKKLPDGSYIVPDKKLFGVSGRCGEMTTRGDTLVLQETDINSETIHIKVNGYTFGYQITDPTKVGKIQMAS